MHSHPIGPSHHRLGSTKPSSPARTGDDTSLENLYQRLRGLAAHVLQNERPGHTLQATALVHEAFMRMGVADGATVPTAETYAHAARVIRQVLIDHARARGAIKRGGDAARAALELESIASVQTDEDFSATLALDEAISRLARVDEQAAEVVRLRFFGGLEIAHTAAALGISERTVKRAWSFARAWLRDQLLREAETGVPICPSGPNSRLEARQEKEPSNVDGTCGSGVGDPRTDK